MKTKIKPEPGRPRQAERDVVSDILEKTGHEFEVQCTKHFVTYTYRNEDSYWICEFERKKFSRDGVVASLLDDLESNDELLEILEG